MNMKGRRKRAVPFSTFYAPIYSAPFRSRRRARGPLERMPGHRHHLKPSLCAGNASFVPSDCRDLSSLQNGLPFLIAVGFLEFQ